MHENLKGASMLPVKEVKRCLLLLACAAVMLGGIIMAAGCNKNAGSEKSTEENQAKRVPFAELFEVNGTTVTPKKVMRIGSFNMSPEVPFDSQTMRIDNTPFTELMGRDAEVKNVGGVLEVKF
jgi:hypothetical protein